MQAHQLKNFALSSILRPKYPFSLFSGLLMVSITYNFSFECSVNLILTILKVPSRISPLFFELSYIFHLVALHISRAGAEAHVINFFCCFCIIPVQWNGEALHVSGHEEMHLGLAKKERKINLLSLLWFDQDHQIE